MSLNISRFILLKDFSFIKRLDFRYLSSLPLNQQNTQINLNEKDKKKEQLPQNDNFKHHFRFIYPEFLPDPNMKTRNLIREKLERMDMLNRRIHIDIPQFYVGSIMAVTASTPHSQGKTSRFLGICIQRQGCGLRANFTLRNVIDDQGIEMMYEMYDPTLLKIEVIKLEKRLDDELLYLRDALPEYSTFPLEMESEFLAEGSEVPVNDIKVKLKPRPWLERWERKDLKGIEKLNLPEKFFKRAEKHKTPWEEFDLMKQYRKTIPEEDQNIIYSEVNTQLHQMEISRRKIKRTKIITKPKKLG